MKRFSLWAAAALFALVGSALAAPPDPGANRRRALAGWIVEDRAEQDGGRLVELRRETGAIHLRHSAAFWRGNDGRVQSWLVERSDCTNGDEIGRHQILTARQLRAQFAHALAECAVPPRRIATVLSGLEPAYALALAWARDAAAATAAEAAAIAAYGADGNSATGAERGPGPPRPH